ncbi:TIGR03089 family protein [Gordonia sp. OPL2]|uniref:TIGR03089 family protein n=1 Tax=Gordonia sp. OPL2 TaxID=2486274 RepID=UPI001654D280|nr:TIGR03089 family protein [Gordonia sp. OPL2]ROZ83325.1 TIGR03089 family protein [Gordonia sp. OPL2]
MAGPTVTAVVFDAVADWSQPLLTFYDDVSGERTELSAATLGNWAAKSANFFVDELGLGPGDEVLIDLPEHWQTAAIMLGAWWAGTHVLLPGRTDSGQGMLGAAVTSVAEIDRYDDVDELLVASLDPFAMGVRDLPFGVTDFASAVRVHGDQYTSRPVVSGPVLDELTTEDVLAAAQSAATSDGIGSGARVLTARPWRTADQITATLLAPLVSGASLVTVAHPDPDRLDARAQTERAGVVLR